MRERHDAGVTARQGLGFTTWRAVCRLVQVLEVSAGLRGRMLAGAVSHGVAVDQGYRPNLNMGATGTFSFLLEGGA
jgi:hypothetical protein